MKAAVARCLRRWANRLDPWEPKVRLTIDPEVWEKYREALRGML